LSNSPSYLIKINLSVLKLFHSCTQTDRLILTGTLKVANEPKKGLSTGVSPGIHSGAVDEAGTCFPEPEPHSALILKGG
jgi:hypothetical protein